MEKSVNRVELKGRVGQDPKILKVDSAVVIRFALATNEVFRGRDNQFREETTWHNVVAWSKRGMPDFETIKKGTFLEVIGRIKYVKYTDAAGMERTTTEINASKIIIPLEE